LEQKNQDIWMFLFYPTQEFLTFVYALTTKLVFDVFVVPIIQSELGGKELHTLLFFGCLVAMSFL
jgi:hypothetical protein